MAKERKCRDWFSARMQQVDGVRHGRYRQTRHHNELNSAALSVIGHATFVCTKLKNTCTQYCVQLAHRSQNNYSFSFHRKKEIFALCKEQIHTQKRLRDWKRKQIQLVSFWDDEWEWPCTRIEFELKLQICSSLRSKGCREKTGLTWDRKGWQRCTCCSAKSSAVDSRAQFPGSKCPEVSECQKWTSTK